MVLRDRAAIGILGSNLVTLVFAVWQGWTLLVLLWPYWIQSVVIGWFSFRRLGALQRFSTEGFKVNGRPVEESAATRDGTARFFALHFGLFHVVYLVFLLIYTTTGTALADAHDSGAAMGGLGPLDPLLLAALGLGFVYSHAASHREHRAADLAGRPNIGTLMFLPYARVLPMHLMIIGGVLFSGEPGIWLFGTLKTFADLLMHRVERHLALQVGAPPEAGR